MDFCSVFLTSVSSCDHCTVWAQSHPIPTEMLPSAGRPPPPERHGLPAAAASRPAFCCVPPWTCHRGARLPACGLLERRSQCHFDRSTVLLCAACLAVPARTARGPPWLPQCTGAACTAVSSVACVWGPSARVCSPPVCARAVSHVSSVFLRADFFLSFRLETSYRSVLCFS